MVRGGEPDGDIPAKWYAEPMVLLLACSAPRVDDGTTDSPPGTTTRADDTGPGDTAPADDDTGSASPTWSDDVAPIFEAHCLTCHQAAGPASFGIETWEEAAPWADAIAAEVSAGTMPPWLVDTSGECQTWRDAPTIDAAAVATLSAWAAAGAPEGEGLTLTPPEPPSLAEIDWSADIGAEYTPSEADIDDFRCILLDRTGRDTEYMTGFEMVPTAVEQTHHITVMLATDASAHAELLELDAADPDLGWQCTTPPADLASPIAIWHQGMNALQLPEGTGVELPADLPILLYTHYYTVDGVASDRTELHLDTEDTVEHVAQMPGIQRPGFALPAGEASYTLEGESTLADLGLPEGTQILGMGPHMHSRGVELSVVAHTDDGDVCLVRTSYWNYHFQRMFFYEEPVTIGIDDTITLTCTWDTSAESEAIQSGPSAWQEMCLAAVYAIVD